MNKAEHLKINQVVFSSLLSNTYNAELDERFTDIKSILSENNDDFSFIKHLSKKGDLSLKIAKSFPNSVVLSYESSKEQALKHAINAYSMNVTNNIIGNPLNFFQIDAHDAIEHVIVDLRSSLDLLDFQFIPIDFFLLFYHIIHKLNLKKHYQKHFLWQEFHLFKLHVFLVHKKLDTCCYVH